MTRPRARQVVVLEVMIQNADPGTEPRHIAEETVKLLKDHGHTATATVIQHWPWTATEHSEGHGPSSPHPEVLRMHLASIRRELERGGLTEEQREKIERTAKWARQELKRIEAEQRTKD